jgi:hypothetical protein
MEGLAASVLLIAILLGVLLIIGASFTCSRNACRSDWHIRPGSQ